MSSSNPYRVRCLCWEQGRADPVFDEEHPRPTIEHAQECERACGSVGRAIPGIHMTQTWIERATIGGWARYAPPAEPDYGHEIEHERPPLEDYVPESEEHPQEPQESAPEYIQGSLLEIP